MKGGLFCVLLMLCLLTSCGTGRITSTDTKAGQVIVFGRFEIQSNNFQDFKSIRLHFNERLYGKYTVECDDKGYFFIKLPAGKNFLALVECFGDNLFYTNLPDNYLSINLIASHKVYYVGDITMGWTPSKRDVRVNNIGVTAGNAIGGAIERPAYAFAEGNKRGTAYPVTALINRQTIELLNKAFPKNRKEIITLPIQVDKSIQKSYSSQ